MSLVRRELAATLDELAAAYARAPESRRPVPLPDDGHEIDAAFAAGDRERALQAVRAWREWWLARIGGDVD